MQNLKDIPCLILGIGNILWADEGFGVRVVEAFNDKYAFTDPNNVIAWTAAHSVCISTTESAEQKNFCF